MNILISGGSGLLGQYLNIELSKNHKILSLYNLNIGNCPDFNSLKIDLLNYSRLEEVFANFHPEIVLHTAAFSNPQLSSQVPSKQVYELNVNATLKIAELCKKFESKMIYTSTDLVYAGYRGSMLKENAKLAPVSLYAETKLMGEIKIQQTFKNYIILRTSLLFGAALNHSVNHFQNMFLDIRQGKKVKLFIDQYRTPLSLIEAAKIINRLIECNIKGEIINFGGRERVSRFELGEKLCEFLNFDKNQIVKIKMADVPNISSVADVSMNTDKLQSLGIKQKSIDEMISEILNIT